MSARTHLFFWSAVAASVFLLGGALATYKRVSSGGSTADVALLMLSVAALSMTLFVAGRIVRAVARVPRRSRAASGSEDSPDTRGKPQSQEPRR